MRRIRICDQATKALPIIVAMHKFLSTQFHNYAQVLCIPVDAVAQTGSANMCAVCLVWCLSCLGGPSWALNEAVIAVIALIDVMEAG